MILNILLAAAAFLTGVTSVRLGFKILAIPHFLLMLFLLAWQRRSWEDAVMGVVRKRPWRWLWALAGIAAGIWANRLIMFPTSRWVEGLFYFYLAAWAIYEAFPSKIEPMTTVEPAPTHPGDRSFLELLLYLLPFVWLVMYYYFYHEKLHQAFWALALVGILTAVARLGRREGKDGTLLRNEWKWFGGLFVLAALFRFPFMTKLLSGFMQDEALDHQEAIHVVQEISLNPFRTGWGGSPILPYWIRGQIYKFIGIDLWAIRLISMTVSMLAIYMFYRLCRLFFGARASLLTTLFFAISWWHMLYAFSPFSAIFTLLFEICVYYFLERGLREGRKEFFWWSGFFMACAVQSYLPGRFVPVTAFLMVVGTWVFTGRPLTFLKTYTFPLILTALACLWFLSPFLVFSWQNPQEFMGRMQQLNMLDEVKRTGNHMLPFVTFGWSSLSFLWAVGSNPAFQMPNGPNLDYFAGLLMVVGLVLTILSPTRRLTWLILPGLVFGVAANAMALQCQGASANYVQAMRMFFALPFLMMMVGRAADWFFGLYDTSGGLLRLFLRCALAAGLVASFFFNIKTFYWWGDRQNEWEGLGYHMVEQSKLHKPLNGQVHQIIEVDSYSPILEYFGEVGRYKVLVVSDELAIPIMNQVTKDVVLYTKYWKLVKAQEEIKKCYPNAQVTDYRNKWNQIFLRVIRIPLSDLLAAQKGKTLLLPLP
jgi:hypothetical protein